MTRLAAENPTMWEYETLRLESLVTANDDQDRRSVVRNANGDEIFASGSARVAAPRVSTSAAIYDSGGVVGEVTITRSLRETLQLTVAIFGLSASLAIAAFMVLTTLPLRLLRAATDRAAFLASHDPLTGVPNRSLFNEWCRFPSATQSAAA